MSDNHQDPLKLRPGPFFGRKPYEHLRAFTMDNWKTVATVLAGIAVGGFYVGVFYQETFRQPKQASTQASDALALPAQAARHDALSVEADVLRRTNTTLRQQVDELEQKVRVHQENVASLSSDLAVSKGSIARLGADLVKAEQARDTERALKEKAEREVASLKDRLPSEPQSAGKNPEPLPSTPPSAQLPPPNPITVKMGAVVRITHQLNISLSSTTRDGDGRRAAKFYLNGLETKERAFPGQRVLLPPVVPPGCFLEVLSVQYSPTFATVEYSCP